VTAILLTAVRTVRNWVTARADLLPSPDQAYFNPLPIRMAA
jgi:hypothetical protein